MNKLIRFTAIGLVVALLSASLAQAPDKLVLARGASGILYAVEQVAIDQGFFEKEGIELDILAATGSAGTTALLAGEADIAPSLAQFIPAAEQGAPLVAFASAFQQFGILWALSNDAIERVGVPTTAPIDERIRALKGLRIGISRSGSTVDVLTRVLVSSVGMNPDRDIHLVPVGGGASMVAALQRGDIDGYAFTSPFVEEAEVRGLGQVFINLETGEVSALSGAPHVIYYTTRSKLEAKRDTFVRFTRALALAMDWIHENPEAAEDVMAAYLSDMEPALIETAWNAAYAAFPTDPAIKPQGLERSIEVLAGPDSSLTFETLVDESIVRDALQGLR